MKILIPGSKSRRKFGGLSVLVDAEADAGQTTRLQTSAESTQGPFGVESVVFVRQGQKQIKFRSGAEAKIRDKNDTKNKRIILINL